MTDRAPSTPEPADPAGQAATGQPVDLAAAGQPADRAATGHPAVDEALRALDDAAGAPPAEQIPAYEAALHVLQQTLATIDEG